VKSRETRKGKKLKNLIITASTPHFADALADTWLPSLKANMDLSNTEVVILAYDFKDEDVARLQGARIIRCKSQDNVTVTRFRDIYCLLKQKKYDQVLAIDGGDILFQDDLKEAFETNKDHFRAMTELISMPYRTLYLHNFFRKEDVPNINDTLKGKKLVNIGVLIGPYEKFKKLSRDIYNLIEHKNFFGPDTIAVNYFLQQEGYKELDEKFNFVITVSKHRFFIKDSIFYFKDKRKISIVHNAGGNKIFRVIKDFGFGPGHNQLRRVSFFLQRHLIQTLDRWFNKSRSPIRFK